MAEGVSSKIGSARLQRGACGLTSKTHAEVTVTNYGYPGSQGAGPEQRGTNLPKTMSSICVPGSLPAAPNLPPHLLTPSCAHWLQQPGGLVGGLRH